MSLAPWMRRLPNRGQLYERLVLDSLPEGTVAVARGAPDAPFDLVVRGPDGVERLWDVKGNELDARGPFAERRRFSVTRRELEFAARARERLQLALLWLDPAAARYGYTVLSAARVPWKSPASPKYVLRPAFAFPLDLDLRRYRPAREGRRLAAAWNALLITAEARVHAVTPE